MTDKEYILSLIDWKFFNFLKDKATRFEDDGHIITIYAIVRSEKEHSVGVNDTYL